MKNAPALLGCGASFHSLKRPTGLGRCWKSSSARRWKKTLCCSTTFRWSWTVAKSTSGPVCGAWHEHFYPAPDGTPFKATYAFDSECELAGCFAAIEVAENLDSIIFNGERVSALKAEAKADHSIRRRVGRTSISHAFRFRLSSRRKRAGDRGQERSTTSPVQASTLASRTGEIIVPPKPKKSIFAAISPLECVSDGLYRWLAPAKPRVGTSSRRAIRSTAGA